MVFCDLPSYFQHCSAHGVCLVQLRLFKGLEIVFPEEGLCYFRKILLLVVQGVGSSIGTVTILNTLIHTLAHSVLVSVCDWLVAVPQILVVPGMG